MKHTPIYVGKSGQQIYRFDNGLGASVVDDPEHSKLGRRDGVKNIAVIKLLNGTSPDGGFHLDYFTPFGAPQQVDAKDVDSSLDKIAAFTPDELKAHRSKLLSNYIHYN